jgi:hypothetical protein
MDADKAVRKKFCMQMFHRIQEDEIFLNSVILSDVITFHVICKVNTHNRKFRSAKNPCVSLEHVCHSPTVNVFCALSKERDYGPFLFIEMTITGIVYLNMLPKSSNNLMT